MNATRYLPFVGRVLIGLPFCALPRTNIMKSIRASLFCYCPSWAFST
jgi:hypothetical protein